jgi:hypothetical protein
MVAPPEVPRNAGAKRRPRCSTMVEVERNQRQYKGRSPKASAQNVVTPVTVTGVDWVLAGPVTVTGLATANFREFPFHAFT